MVGGIIPLRRATSSRYDGRLEQESASRGTVLRVLAPFDLLATQVVPFELGWSLLSSEYGANVKKRATLVRGPKTTQQYKSLYWAELGLGELGLGQKAFNSITQIGVLSSLVLACFDSVAEFNFCV